MDRKNATRELKKREWLANFRLEKTVLVTIWTIAVLVTEAYNIFFGLGESWIASVAFAVVIVVAFVIVTTMHGAAYERKLQERKSYLEEAASNYFLGGRARPKLDIDYFGKKYIFHLPGIDLLPITDFSDQELQTLQDLHNDIMKDPTSPVARQAFYDFLRTKYESEINEAYRQAGFASQCQHRPIIRDVVFYTKPDQVISVAEISNTKDDVYIYIDAVVIIPFLTSSPFRRQ